jgi:hypothetical protein
MLSLGAMDGDPALSFDRLSGVYVIGRDRVAVLDDGASQVRFFGLDGAPLSTFGRPGEGPGEFQSLAFVGLHADSLWLFDGRQQRITVLDPRSSGFRVARAAVDNAALGSAGLLLDGTMVFVSDLAFSSAIADAASPGLQRFRAAYVRVGPLGELRDTVLVTPGSERILRFGPQTVEVIRPLLAKSVSHAVRNQEIVQGTQDAYEIRVYTGDGVLQNLIRRTGVDVRVDERSYNAAAEERVLAAPEPARPGLRTLFQEQAIPENRPAYSRFLVDVDGFLWVQDFSYYGDARSWAVFDREGVWLGGVAFPDRFRPSQILGDRVAGVWRDELDVEYARVYELTRS